VSLYVCVNERERESEGHMRVTEGVIAAFMSLM
jgi:hypothetical protein